MEWTRGMDLLVLGKKWRRRRRRWCAGDSRAAEAGVTGEEAAVID